MRSPLTPLLALLVLLAPVTTRSQDSVQGERAAASFLLAQGRPATAVELSSWGAKAGLSLAALYSQHREALAADTPARQAVAERAAQDAYGRTLTAAELAAVPAGAVTYSEWLQRHVATLAARPDAYRQVIDRAYRFVIGRETYDLEYDYWRQRPALPYVLLVGTIENWAQRNAPGLMVTSGQPSVSVNCRFLTTQRLAPAVANEARVILGLPVWTDVARQLAPDRNLVAVGSGDITSVGGMHFVLVGGDRFK